MTAEIFFSEKEFNALVKKLEEVQSVLVAPSDFPVKMTLEFDKTVEIKLDSTGLDITKEYSIQVGEQ